MQQEIIKQEPFTEQDILTLKKRQEAQEKLFKSGKIHKDVYQLNRIALKKSIRAAEAVINNQIVDPKTNQRIEGITKDGKLDIHVYLNAKGHVPPLGKLAEVYEDRSKYLIAAYICLGIYLVSQSPSWQITVFSFFLNFFWYDLFSGILHVCLDDPRNLIGWRSAILYKPCLEFQWHHVIPADIASKPYYQSIGDLNFVVGLIFAFQCCMGILSNPTAMVLSGFKFFFAYYGQFSHKMSHTFEGDRSIFVNLLQKSHILLSEKDHKVHHTNHDDNFCIGSGTFNGVIRSLLKITTNPNVWFCIFGYSLFFDAFTLSFIIDKLFMN